MLRGLGKKFLRDESGQTTTEYILILAVVVLIAVKFRDRFKGLMDGILEKLGTKVQTFDDEL